MKLMFWILASGLLALVLLARPASSCHDSCRPQPYGDTGETIVEEDEDDSGGPRDREERAVPRGRRYTITVDDDGFQPDELTIPAGRPVTLVVRRTSEETCAREILIPALKLRRSLPLGRAVEIQLPAQRKGTIRFACGMDMVTGVIRIEGARKTGRPS